MIKVYVDAACNGNPGYVGIGMMVYKDKKQMPLMKTLPTKMTNHQAEYEAVYMALRYLQEQNWQDQTIVLYSDSQVIVTALNRRSAKAEWQQPYLKKILPLLDEFSLCFIEWFSDKDNKIADTLAKRALQNMGKENLLTV